MDSPEVQTAIATRVTDAIETQVDVEALLNQAFAGVIQDRPRLQLLIGPIAGAVNGLIESQVQSFISLGRLPTALGWRSTRGRRPGSSSC